MSHAAIAPHTPPFLKTRLSVMMFMQYAIWGAWLPILYPFLMGYRKFTLDETGAVLAAGAAGAIFGPFIAGQLADRIIATERLLALSHLLGAGLVWFLAGTDQFWPFLVLSGLYGLIYAPTLALTNSLAFAHLPDRDRDFGPVRLWGTIGWIVVGILVGQILLREYTPAQGTAAEIAAVQDGGRVVAFKVSALIGVAMAFYSLTLPHTPPHRTGGKAGGRRAAGGSTPSVPSQAVVERPRAMAVVEALREIRLQPLVTLFLVAVPVSMIHQFYFVHASGFISGLQLGQGADGFVKWVNGILGVGGGGLMTIGQMAEIAVLGLMPFLTRVMSRKALLLTGLAAYAVRMALFAYAGDSVGLVMTGIALHGLCFGCFIFVAFMVVDENTTHDVRATAQNLFNLVIVGIGIIVGSWFSTSIVGRWATVDGQMDFTRLFSVPLWMAVACFLVMLVVYPGGRGKKPVGA